MYTCMFVYIVCPITAAFAPDLYRSILYDMCIHVYIYMYHP